MTTRNGNLFESGTGRIRGIVACVPSGILPSAGWLMAEEAAKVTGVDARRISVNGDAEDLCFEAAAALLNGLQWASKTVTALVFVTQTPNQRMPAPAFTLHHRLQLDQSCDVVQVNYSCSGYVKGLKLAQKLATRPDARVLLLVGDVSSRMCDPADRATAPLFGDAGSATAVEFDPMASDFFITGCDGVNNDRLSQVNVTPHNRAHMHMDGAAVFNFTLKRVPGLVEDLTALTPMPDLLLFHQANKFMLDHLVKKTRLLEHFSPKQIPTNLERFGNCSSASIPLLLADWWHMPSDRIMIRRAAMLGFGSGWSWGAASVDLTGLEFVKVVEL
jgi:3-oxoacyl-[acyl-carrier-protein] synthase-3